LKSIKPDFEEYVKNQSFVTKTQEEVEAKKNDRDNVEKEINKLQLAIDNFNDTLEQIKRVRGNLDELDRLERNKDDEMRNLDQLRKDHPSVTQKSHAQIEEEITDEADVANQINSISKEIAFMAKESGALRARLNDANNKKLKLQETLKEFAAVREKKKEHQKLKDDIQKIE
jgi:chromosome segregation ATPase